MTPAWRRSLSACGLVGAVAGLCGMAAASALSLLAAQADLGALAADSQALQAREKRFLARPGRDPGMPPAFEANTVTLAGAALQARVEAAVAAAKGRLVSAKLDVDSHEAERRVAIAAELTMAEPDIQALLFDLETGRPYLFVDNFDARAPESAGEGGLMRVSLTLSAQWSATK